MARILVNYIYNKQKDEYKLLEPDCVYADQKVAVLETEEIINRPLVVPIGNNMTVVDRDKYESVHKRFYFLADENGIIYEDPNGTEVWLPKDTDVSKLRYINNRIVMVESKEPQQEEKVEEEKPKSKKK